jgi:SAM-dependent methyltransferase
MKTGKFTQSDYWQGRVRGDIDLGVVGQRSLGRAYNEYIYKRRLDVLTKTLESIQFEPEKANILDIGCGSGYYVGYWQSLGVRKLHGVDIAADSVQRMQQAYPQYSFTRADITQEGADAQFPGKFSIITIFDVLYHIDDDEKVRTLLATVSRNLKEDGHLIIFDQLCKHDYMLTPHVKFRSEASFSALLKQAGLCVRTREPLFVFLAPPIYGRKYIDIVVSGLYKIFGYLLRSSHRIGSLAGRAVYGLDNALRRTNISTPNHALFLAGKAEKSDSC